MVINMQNSIPKEIAEYFKNGPRNVIKVWSKEPYTIVAEFDDGIIKASDLTDDLTGIMAILKDYNIFKTVSIDENGSIAWNTANGHIDISKDNIYIYGKTLI
jgi:hypothetical protein